MCKIDLKGRFVFIDDETEELLGFTREELFGRPFLDFLAEDDQEVINSIISRRYHFETFFKTTRIGLIHKDGQRVPATVVISLNFIAGSPVNYQFIINAGTSSDRGRAPRERFAELQDLIAELLRFPDSVQWTELARAVRTFCGGNQVLLYRLRDGKPELIEDIGRDSLQEVPSLLKIHQAVAETGQAYDFASEQDVQRAVELDGKAPSEFVSCLQPESESPLLVRVVFKDDMDRSSAARGIQRARFAVDLTSRCLARLGTAASETGVPHDVTRLVEALGKLGIGLLQTSADGRIAAYNSVLSESFEGRRPAGHYDEFVELLSDCNPPHVVEAIRNFCETDPADDDPGQFRTNVNTPSGRSARLAITRQAAGETRGRFSFVLVPDALPGRETIDCHVENSALRQIVTELQTSHDVVTSLCDQLPGLPDADPDKNAGFHRRRLEGQTARHFRMLADLSCLIENIARTEDMHLTDLDAVVSKALDDQRTAYPAVKVSAEVGQLPKIVTCRHRLCLILGNVVSNCFKFAPGELHIRIAATVDDGVAAITVSDNGPGISEGALGRAFRFFARPPGQEAASPSGHGTSLAITRQLARSLGGDITVTSGSGQGTTVTVSIPAGRGAGEEA
ncbi:MAG TPA: ATP-binding protein [Acidobacteriota bacterium]|nr:ATP-binding protein [Acidobacteriota bacterium]